MTIRVRDMKISSRFYGPVFRYLGYELAGHDARYEDWKRCDIDTPHEISIVEVKPALRNVKYVRKAVGHHDHMAFCALDKNDVDTFHREVLLPLEAEGLCTIEDAPCECPEYNEGYYATFFYDPDGLKYEYVINPRHLIERARRG